MEPNLPISAFAIGKLSFALLCALNVSVLPILTISLCKKSLLSREIEMILKK